MKKLTQIFFIIVTLAALGCSNHTTRSKAAGDGGISGGGGGTLPAKALTTAEVASIVEDAHKEVLMFFNSQHYIFLHYSATDYLQIFEHLFANQITIFDILKTTQIELRDKTPCYDSAKNPVDASIYASKPNAICLSSLRIAPKLIQQTARSEIQALIVHELSHFVGLNESQAEGLQREAATFFEGTDPEALKTLSYSVRTDIRNAEILLLSIIEKFDELSNDEIATWLDRIDSDWLNIQKQIVQAKHLNFLDGRGEDLKLLYEAHFSLALWYAMGKSSADDAADWMGEYNKTFENSDSTTLGAYNKIHMSELKIETLFDEAQIQKITGREGLKRELKIFDEHIINLLNYLDDLEVGNYPSILIGPDTKENPFEKLKGSYLVQLIECSSGLKTAMTDIDIYVDHLGRPMQKEIFNGYRSSIVSGLYNNADDVVIGGGTVTVSGDDKSATRTIERFTSWKSGWVKRTETIAQVNESLFSLTIKGESKMHESPLSNYECVYELTKK